MGQIWKWSTKVTQKGRFLMDNSIILIVKKQSGPLNHVKNEFWKQIDVDPNENFLDLKIKTLLKEIKKKRKKEQP